MKFRVDELRKKANQLHLEYEAIRALTNQTRNFQAEIKSAKNTIAKANKEKLKGIIADLQKTTKQLRKHFGCKVPNSKLVSIYETLKAGTRETMPLLAKYYIDEYFNNYDKAIKDFNDFPKHAKIGIDLYGEFVDDGIEVYMLEVVLYENMCALFNLAIEHNEFSQNWQAHPKPKVKTANSLNIATILAAMNFIEAYLNGIAFDYCASHKNLDERTKSLLTEWNYSKGKAEYLSMRNKILQYPRIILNKEHPPLQENNCPEIEYITKKAKLLRDAIVHASPMFDSETNFPEKEQNVYTVNFKEVELLVDQTISLVRKINAIINGNDTQLVWLHKRNTEGTFSEDVFS